MIQTSHANMYILRRDCLYCVPTGAVMFMHTLTTTRPPVWLDQCGSWSWCLGSLFAVAVPVDVVSCHNEIFDRNCFLLALKNKVCTLLPHLACSRREPVRAYTVTVRRVLHWLIDRLICWLFVLQPHWLYTVARKRDFYEELGRRGRGLF
jgi:hypothetical protein